MCYMCLKDDPFAVKPLTTIHRKRQRMMEIKHILKEMEDRFLCDVGDGTIERLKEEQYRLSREM